MPECHSHSHNTWPHAAIIGYLIANDGTFGCIHNESDICFDTTNFNISFICSEYGTGTIIEVINEGFDTDSGGLTVISNTLMRDIDVIKVF